MEIRAKKDMQNFTLKRKRKIVLKKYRIYANGQNEYVQAGTYDKALETVKRRVIKQFGCFVFGGAEIFINNRYQKIS